MSYSEEESFGLVLEAMELGEPAHFLVRARWHALKYDDPDPMILGHAFAGVGRYQEAEKLLNSATTEKYISECRNLWIAENPQIGESVVAGLEGRRCKFMGDLCVCRGCVSLATRWYERALSWRRKEYRLRKESSAIGNEIDSVANLHDMLATCYWRRGRYGKALHHARKAASDPNWSLQSTEFMGIIYRSKGRYRRAVRYFVASGSNDLLQDIREAQTMPKAPVREALWNIEGPVAWVVAGSRFLRNNPDDWDVRRELSLQWCRLFRYDKAITLIRVAERRYAGRATAGTLGAQISAAKAEVFFNQCRYRAAARWFRRSSEMEPANAAHSVNLGICEARLGNFEEAERLLRPATQRSSGSQERAWYNLGLVLRSKENFHEAACCFEKTLQLNPNHEKAGLALSDVEKAGTFERFTGSKPGPGFHH